MVQALISVDEVTLRLGFWVAVAGVVSPAAGPVTVEAVTPKASRIRNWVAGGVAVVVTGVGIVYAVAFVLADRDARQGNHLFAEGRVREGASALGSAIAMRNETLYREVLAGRLGIAASETGAGGAPLIERMREVNAYLDELPDVGALHAYARLMSYWSHHDESARPVALDLYHRVAELDPVNPLITVETAEVLVDLGRTEEALSMLEALRDDLTGRVPEYWGALSMTRLAAGDLGGAATALAEATRIDPTDCRVRLADTLVTLHGADPSAEPANDALRLILSCDPGLYDMFLRRLPSRYMDRYS
jgi:tetratricopeptide (TPR) repeat protein